MSESRYYPAHGARPHAGPRAEVWGHEHYPTGYRGAPGGWPQPEDAGPQGHAPQAQPGPALAAAHDPYGVQGHAQESLPGYAGYSDPYAPDLYGPEGDIHADAHGAYRPQGHVPPAQGGMPQMYASGQRQGRAYPSADPADPVQPITATGIAQGLGAVLSLALLISGGVWTWNMMQRDVSGVPVVRALEGPMRVAPDDPGGAQAAHQGLSVTELAADGPSDIPNEIVLAPPPLDLTRDAPQDPDASRPARAPSGSSEAEEQLIEISLPLSDTERTVAPEPLGLVQPNRLAVTRSPRPTPRGAQDRAAAPVPDGNDTALAASIANTVAADLARSDGGVDVDPSSIGPGTRLVQLGTYDSAAAARSAWGRLSQRFDPLLDDRGRVIEAAHSGGSVFYRLRAHGFSDERDARRFCAALIDQNMDCIPVLIR